MLDKRTQHKMKETPCEILAFQDLFEHVECHKMYLLINENVAFNLNVQYTTRIH